MAQPLNNDVAWDGHDGPAVSDLVVRLLHGQHEAFETLFDRHARRVYNIAYRISGDAVEAEDVTQETFLRALGALHTLREPQAFAAWLCQIATNLSLEALRRRRRLPQAELTAVVAETYPDDARWHAPEAVAMAWDDSRAVRATLSRLSPRQRAALVLREMEGLSYAAIAETLGIGAGAVETLIFRARRRFREQYERVAAGTTSAHPALGCREARAALAVTLDGEWSGPERAAILAHVRSCAACQGEIDKQRALRKVWAVLPLVPLPATLKPALLAHLAPVAGLATGTAATGTAATGAAATATASSGAGAAGTGSLVAAKVAAIGGAKLALLAASVVVVAGGARVWSASHATPRVAARTSPAHRAYSAINTRPGPSLSHAAAAPVMSGAGIRRAFARYTVAASAAPGPPSAHGSAALVSYTPILRARRSLRVVSAPIGRPVRRKAPLIHYRSGRYHRLNVGAHAARRLAPHRQPPHRQRAVKIVAMIAPVPPSATATDTAVPLPPTATSTPVPPSATATTIPPTATNTPVPPAATETPMPPTATATVVPPTATSPPPTATRTPMPPTATPLPPTATDTPIPPTETDTPIPSTATTGASAKAAVPVVRNRSAGCTLNPVDGQAEAQLLRLLNSHRAAAHVHPLTWDARLAASAHAHSCDMFLLQTMTHTGLDRSDPVQRIVNAGVSFTALGENISMASGHTAADAVALLDATMMAEPLAEGSHRWNIVSAGYTHVGVGVIYANGQAWLTEDFVG